MEGIVKISEFFDELERRDLVIVPRKMVERRAEMEQKRAVALRKKLLTFREICESGIWGDNVQQQAVRAFAKKYAKDGEIIEVKRGQRPEYKITIGAVERIAKIRGTWHNIAK